MAIIVMSNGDAYHVTEETATDVVNALSVTRVKYSDGSTAVLPPTGETTVAFLDTRSNKRVMVVLSQVSSVVRDGEA